MYFFKMSFLVFFGIRKYIILEDVMEKKNCYNWDVSLFLKLLLCVYFDFLLYFLDFEEVKFKIFFSYSVYIVFFLIRLCLCF